MSNEVILDLAKLDQRSRERILKECAASGWTVRKEVSPKVHPDRKISPHFYCFSIPGGMDRVRDRHLGIALKAS